MAPRIIKDNTTLVSHYDELGPGDIVVGRLRLRRGEEHLLLALESRGVVLIPSATAQLCSRSKVFQARILGRFMLPWTKAVYDMHDLLDLVSGYGREQVGRVVCKLDRANGGLGILLYQSIEDVYTQAALGALLFPFVLQPFAEQGRDIRVVLLGDYVEAYQRHNAHNFRHNLHCGGKSTAWILEDDQLDLCRQVMTRAGFLYAHVDLLLTPEGGTYLNEINLRGGLRGAVVGQQEYLAAVESIHAHLVRELQEYPTV